MQPFTSRQARSSVGHPLMAVLPQKQPELPGGSLHLVISTKVGNPIFFTSCSWVAVSQLDPSKPYPIPYSEDTAVLCGACDAASDYICPLRR